jgi:ABC-type antimicrobial peptide transport system permease subunit
VSQVRSLAEVRWAKALPRRQIMALVAIFGGLALLMAALGLWGLMTSQVLFRTRELGIRATLGAAPRDLLALVLGQAARRTLLGLLLGLGASLALAGLVRSQLYGVESVDALSLLAASGLLLSTAFVSALLPARRAARVQPDDALRSE